MTEENFADLIARLTPIIRQQIKEERSHAQIINGKAVRIGERTYISNAVLNASRGQIVIGNDTFFGNEVMINAATHNPDAIGNERRYGIVLKKVDVTIGNGVWIGSRAMIIGPCRIGDYAVIAAGAIVTKDVPPGVIVMGVAATIKRKILAQLPE